jgi:hypothetical protein
MKLSIIIVCWNVRRDLLRCLQSIKEYPADESFEIIVVDNAGTDGTVEAVKKNFSEVTIIENKENRGFSAANNQAIRIAKGQYLFLLNPDTLVHPGSLDTMIQFLDNHPGAGACGPNLGDEDGTAHNSVGYVPTFRSLLYRKTFFKSLGIFRGHYRKLQADNFNYDRQADVEQLSGAALMVRRSVMNEIGLMDESFFLYYEDVDLCLRIRKARWKIVYVPDALITHAGGKSTQQMSAKKNIILYKSIFIYLRKHKGKLSTTLFAFVFKPGIIIRELLNVLSNGSVYLFSILSHNRYRQAKSLTKVTNSAIFLAKYMWEFIFVI